MKRNLCLLFAVGLLAQSSFARLSVSPWNVNFGRVEVDQYVPSRTVWVRNIGDLATKVDVRDSFCGADIRISDNCYWELEPNQSCSIRINYRPYREGYHSCNIDVIDDDLHRERVRVTGQAVRKR